METSKSFSIPIVTKNLKYEKLHLDFGDEQRMGIIVTLAGLQLPLSAHTQRVNIAFNLQRRMGFWSHYFYNLTRTGE